MQQDPLPGLEDLEKEYGRLVRYLARQQWHRLSTEQRRLYDLTDLVQSGWLGLLQAQKRFKACYGVRPSIFFTYRVRGAILDTLRATDSLSQARRQQYREVERVREQLHQQHRREVTMGEIAAALGVPEDEIQTLLVDAALETTRLAVRPEPTSSSDDPETKALNQAHYEALWKCLRALEPRQFELVRLRYFTSSELTLQAIADSLGFSLATAHGRLQQAFTRLRRCLQAQGWDVQ